MMKVGTRLRFWLSTAVIPSRITQRAPNLKISRELGGRCRFLAASRDWRQNIRPP